MYVFVEKIDLEGDGVKSKIFSTPFAPCELLQDVRQQLPLSLSFLLGFTKFLESTEASPENDSKWSIASWDEARPIFEECRSDLEKLWRCQLRALKEERLEMERRELEEEKLVDLDRRLEEVAVGGETG